MSALRADGFFTPPSLKGTLVIPGNVGGMAWGGIAHDRINDLLDHAGEQSRGGSAAHPA